MKYTEKIKDKITEYIAEGKSSRWIADKLGISKSGVNDFFLRELVPLASVKRANYIYIPADSVKAEATYSDTPYSQPSKQQGPRVLFLDIETSAALVYAFGRHKQFIHQDAVKEEGGKILMAGYAFNDEPVHLISAGVGDHGEYHNLKEILDVVSKADVIVAHNGKYFDIPMIQARLVEWGFDCLPHTQIIDTLEIAKKKFRFPSNKLDSLGAYFGVGRKNSHSGIDLWVRVQEGDAEALEEMENYCIQDVELLREVFYKMRNRGLVSAFNAAHYYDDEKERCKTCGSDNIKTTGKTIKTPVGSYDEVVCLDCGTKHRKKKNKLTKEKRSSLLVGI